MLDRIFTPKPYLQFPNLRLTLRKYLGIVIYQLSIKKTERNVYFIEHTFF